MGCISYTISTREGRGNDIQARLVNICLGAENIAIKFQSQVPFTEVEMKKFTRSTGGMFARRAPGVLLFY